MSPGIGVGVGLPFVHLQRRGAPSPSLFTGSAGGAYFETANRGASRRIRVLPNAGVISAASRAENQVGSNIGSAISSGYVEVRCKYPDNGVGVSTSYGIMHLFGLSDFGSNSRYFDIYIANGIITIDNYDAGGSRRVVSSPSAYRVPAGWHTIRVTSSGSAYSITVDGEALSPLQAAVGSNDGNWTNDLHAGVDGVVVGALVRASTTPSFNGTTNVGEIAYVDFNNAHKWIFNDGEAYVYDVIGGVHLAWQGAGAHVARSEGGSTYPGTDGYSLWQKESEPDIHAPYSSGGSALSLTPGTNIPTGYTKTRDVAGSSAGWNSAHADVEFRDVGQASGFVYGINFGTPDLNTNSGTRTWFIRYPHSRVGTTGKLRGVKFYYGYSANTSAFKLQIWRKNGSTYDPVHNVNIFSLLPTSSGIVDITLATALAVVEGDFVALCVTNSSTDNVLLKSPIGSVANSTVYVDEEKTDSFNFETGTNASANLNVELYIDAPAVVCVGDSIMAGRPGYASIIEGGFLSLFDRDNQIPYHIEQQDARLSFMNFGVGGETLSEIYDQLDYALRVQPSMVLVNGGTNDVAGGETDNAVIVSAYEAVVDRINAAGCDVVALSVPPWTNGTDVQAAQIDALNVLLAAMMADKDGIFVDLTETLGAFRTGGDPGNLWDLDASYDADGVHLTTAGAEAAGLAAYAAINAAYSLTDRLAVPKLDRSDGTYASAASQAADSYDAANPYRFSVVDLNADLTAYFESGYEDSLAANINGDDIESVVVKP